MSSRKDTDDPISGQSFSLLSYHILDKVDEKGKNYVVLKNRGNYASEHDAQLAAKSLAECDPKNTVHVFRTGHWVLLSSNPKSETSLTVGSEPEKYSPDSEASIAARNKQRQQMKEIEARKREMELAEKEDMENSDDNIVTYIKKRNVITSLMETVISRQKEISRIEEKLKEFVPLLLDLEKKNPSFIDDWLDVLNTERQKAGLPPYKDAPEIMSFYEKIRSTN